MQIYLAHRLGMDTGAAGSIITSTDAVYPGGVGAVFIGDGDLEAAFSQNNVSSCFDYLRADLQQYIYLSGAPVQHQRTHDG